MERMAPTLIVFPEYELVVPPPPPPLEPHAASTRTAASQLTKRKPFISASPSANCSELILNLSNRPNSGLQPLLQARNVEPRAGILRVHLLESLQQDPGDGPVAIVLVVRRDHVPGRPLSGALRDRDAVRAHVVVPVSPLVDVGFVELPVLVGIAKAVDQPASLLVVGDVEADLDHR